MKGIVLYIILCIIFTICCVIAFWLIYNKDRIEKFKDAEMQCIVINLPRNKHRLELFRHNYKLPIPCVMKEAVDGYTLNAESLYKDGILSQRALMTIQGALRNEPKTNHADIRSLGAVGCSLSHIGIWNDMITKKTELTFVLEDDAQVDNIKIDDIMKRLSKLPKDWHIYMIGHPHTQLQTMIHNDHDGLDRVMKFCGTHAYIINLKGAKYLIEHQKLFPLDVQIDSYLSDCCHNTPSLNIYIHKNMPMVYSFSEDSDIQM